MYCCLQIKGAPKAQLSTKLIEDPHNVVSYAGFLVARGVNQTTLRGHMANIHKVLVWRTSLGGAAHHIQQLERVDGWWEAFFSQCGNLAPPSTSRLQRTKLPHAREVIRLQVKVEATARDMLAEDIRQRGAAFRRNTYRALLEAAILALMFGHLPPVRLACIRSCLHPDHVLPSGGCMDEGCR